MKPHAINNNHNVGFKANIPKTLAKKSADKLAKEFASSGDFFKIEIAERYFNALERLKEEKNIKEAVVVAALCKNSAQVILDGYPVESNGVMDEISKFLPKQKQFAYNALNAVIAAGRSINSCLKSLNNFRNSNRPRRDWHE